MDCCLESPVSGRQFESTRPLIQQFHLLEIYLKEIINENTLNLAQCTMAEKIETI